jgi:hypothetical protein
MDDEKKLNPTALTIEKAAKALGVGREILEADIAAGAPVNADGTVNLVHYAAWLVKELAARGD